MRSARVVLACAATFAVAALAVACGSDYSTQPTDAASATSSKRHLAPSPIGKFDRYSTSQYYATVRFTINPNSDTYVQIGPHYLYIPQGAVCDPATSGYGVLTWALPCKSAPKSITVTATSSLGKDGHPIVDFDTHLRFRPTPSTDDDVIIYLRDDLGNQKSVINWCADSAASSCVDETKTTVTGVLTTKWDSRGLYVYRKIQHFSGYNVTGGRDCDTDCGTGIGGGM